MTERIGSKRLSAHLHQSEDLADATVRIIDPETSELIKTIPVHSMVFALKSPVFKLMFYGEMGSKSVDIKDVDYPTFAFVAEYVYLSNVAIVNATEGILLHKAADRFLMEDLKKICSDWLCINVNTDNALGILNYAIFLEDEPIINAALEVINLNDDIIRSDGFIDVKAETVKAILFKCQLNMPEVDVLTACLRWCSNQMESGEKSMKSFKELLLKAGIADGISFKHVSSTDFFTALEAMEVIPENKAFRIMKNLSRASADQDLDSDSPVRFHKLRALDGMPPVPPQRERDVHAHELTTIDSNAGRVRLTRLFGYPDKNDINRSRSTELVILVTPRSQDITLIGFTSVPLRSIRFTNQSNANTEELLKVINNASNSLHVEFRFQNPVHLKRGCDYKFKVTGNNNDNNWLVEKRFRKSDVKTQTVEMVLIGSWISSMGLIFSDAR